MKLSELIESLTKVYNEGGDTEVTLSGSVRVRTEDGDIYLDSNCRYEYDYLYDLNICRVEKSDDGCMIEFDDF